MICYRDRTYCDAPCGVQGCDRMATLEVALAAKRIGLPLALSDFRETCPDYRPPPAGAAGEGETPTHACDETCRGEDHAVLGKGR